MKSKFFCGLSVLVVAIAAASCAGQSNKPTSTPAQTSNSQAGAGCYYSDGGLLWCPNSQASPTATIPSGPPANGTGTVPGGGNANGAGGGSAGAFTAGGYEAYQQGANSVADLNVSKRGGMVSSALRNWQAPAEQQDAATTLAQNTPLADPFADAGNSAAVNSEDAAILPPPVPEPPPCPDPSSIQADPKFTFNHQLWRGLGEISGSVLTIAGICAVGVPTGGGGALVAAVAAQEATVTFVAGTVNVWSAFTANSTVGERTDQFLGAVKNPAGQFTTAFTGDLDAGSKAANIFDGMMTFAALPEMDLPGHPVLSLFNANQAATSLQEGTMAAQSALSSIRPPSFAYPSPMPTPPLPSRIINAGIDSPTPQPAPTASPEPTPPSN